ncbi:MAG: stage II sporulation protein M [Desulfobacteraceae bacterium]|nr:stage II sporulation protein M [Desulfobacteraceae bacterium]
MIIDLKKFITAERPYWEELAAQIKRSQDDPYRRMSYEQIRRLHYLYQRASADLAKISTFSAERSIRDYLENLVGRAYAMIHATRQTPVRFSPVKWFCNIFPQTLRRHWAALALSVSIFLAGAIFGGAALIADPEAKAILMPFDHLQAEPSERVAGEENASRGKDHLRGVKSSFSARLMTHNTRISIFVLALGMTWGIGTVAVLFSNGVMLGAVAADYIRSGQTAFLFGWLLPHGAIEIPAVLVAGQAGLILAGALIGRKSSEPLSERIRNAGPDVVHLIGGVAVMLIWAGLVEAFFSQYHEPVLPYSIKIAFGVIECILLAGFWMYAGGKISGGSDLWQKGSKRKEALDE